MLWAISGGAGFLGLHLAATAARRRARRANARRRAAGRRRASSAPCRRAARRRPRSRQRRASSCTGADVVVHAAAALPIQASREMRSARSTSAGPRTCCAAARRRRRPACRLHLVDRRLRRAGEASDRGGRSARRRRLVRRVEDRRGGTRAASPRSRRRSCVPRRFIGAGAARRVRDPLRLDPRGRRIYIARQGDNRYQLLAVEDLVDAIVRPGAEPAAAGETFNIGATEFGTRAFRPAGADRPRGLVVVGCSPVPGEAGGDSRCAALELLRVSPLAEWHYKTAHKDSFVDVSKAQRLLGWQPRLSNARRADRDLRLVPREPRAVSAERASRTAFLEPASTRPASSAFRDRSLANRGARAARPRSARRCARRRRTEISAQVRHRCRRGSRRWCRASRPARRDAGVPAVGRTCLQARHALPAERRPPHAPGGDRASSIRRTARRWR